MNASETVNSKAMADAALADPTVQSRLQEDGQSKNVTININNPPHQSGRRGLLGGRRDDDGERRRGRIPIVGGRIPIVSSLHRGINSAIRSATTKKETPNAAAKTTMAADGSVVKADEVVKAQK